MIDAVAALKTASGGLPNKLLRDVQAIHPNMTFADCRRSFRTRSLKALAAFTPLLKEGYAVGPRQQMQAARPWIVCRSVNGRIPVTGADRHVALARSAAGRCR